jgi:quinol-cytochrome oxidoreductase complex cytochrome b subunit
MRLVVAATAVVAGFVMGAWGIARLAPESPAWLKLTLAIVWLFALIFGALLLASKRGRKLEDQRRLLGYGLLTIGKN